MKRRKLGRKGIKLRNRLIFLIILMIMVYISYSIFTRLYIQIEQIQFSKRIDELKNYRSNINQSGEGTTYYIAADGTSNDGTNINEPMSLEEASKKTYYGEDNILFKSGDIFYGTINFSIKASEGKYTYIGSYGIGEKPIISGAKVLNNIEIVEQEGNIYKIDLSIDSSYIGKKFNNYNIGFIQDKNGEIHGIRKKTKQELISQYDFYCEDQFIYVYIQGNINENLSQAKLVCKENLVNIPSNTIIEGLDIQNTGAHGIVKQGTNIKNIYINNCIIQNIGGSLLSEEKFTKYGNGIEFYNGNVENVIIENNIIRNIYDVAFTMQGQKGYWKNIIVQNNIFINNTQNTEIWNKDLAEDINNYQYINNIQINTGRGWGYDVRPNKEVTADILMYAFEAPLTFKIENNTSFNSRRIYYILNVANIEKIISDYNRIYTLKEEWLFKNELKLEQNEILKNKYNLDQNSSFNIIEEREFEKISNTEILNDNDYNKIKSYYENLEKEFAFLNELKTVISKYTELQEEYKNELDIMIDIKSRIENLKNNTQNIESIPSATIWNDINKLYQIGTEIIIKYNNETSLNSQRVKNMLSKINEIGESYFNVINFLELNQEDIDLEEIQNEVANVQILVKSNSDLEINDEKVWIEQANKNLIFSENEEEKNISYQCIKSKYLAQWAKDFTNIRIEEYIDNNPITIEYSKKELTNEDVIATLKITDDCKITNNNSKETYIFKENGEYTFEYIRRGKSFKLTAKVSNIDKQAPIITGIVEGSVYNTPVKFYVQDINLETIEVICNGEQITNYSIGQVLSEEGIYKVKATDKAGNKTEINFTIYEKNEEIYVIEQDKVCNITANTQSVIFTEKLFPSQTVIVKRNGEQIKDIALVATGDIVQLENGKEYTLIVKGDLNGDGIVNITDLIRTQNYLLGRKELTEIERLAADANFDKKIISISDLVRIQILILKQRNV